MTTTRGEERPNIARSLTAFTAYLEFNMTVTQSLLGLGLALASVTSLAAQATPAPILDGIVLSETHLKSYVDNKSKVCHFNWTYEHVAETSGSCYGLPANKVTLMQDPDGKVIYVDIGYEKAFNGETFNKFNQSLRKKYGQARVSNIPFVGNRYVRWEKFGMVVTLDEPHMGFDGTLSYYTKAFWDHLQRSRQETKQKAAKQIDDML